MKVRISLVLECPECGAEVRLGSLSKLANLEDLAKRINHLGNCPNGSASKGMSRGCCGDPDRQEW